LRRNETTSGQIWITQLVDATQLRGTTVTLAAEARADVSGVGNLAHLHATVTAATGGGMASAFTVPLTAVEDDPPITTSEWRAVRLAVKVPEDAARISIGFVLCGTGRAQLRGLTVT